VEVFNDDYEIIIASQCPYVDYNVSGVLELKIQSGTRVICWFSLTAAGFMLVPFDVLHEYPNDPGRYNLRFLDPFCICHTDAIRLCLSGSARDELKFSKSVSGLEADIIGGVFRKPCE